MKFNKISALALLGCVALLASCNGGESQNSTGPVSSETSEPETSSPITGPDTTAVDEKIKTALDSVRGQSYQTVMNYLVAVEYPEDTTGTIVDTFIRNQATYIYGYLSNGQKAVSTWGTTASGDWDPDTHDGIPGRYYSSSTPVATYWRDDENGLTLIENRTLQNTVDTAYVANYDDTTGDVTPVIFDTEFRNPWDYIDYEDLTVNDDGTLTLSQRKADFFTQVYSVTGANTVTDAKITLDDQGRIDTVSLTIPELTGDGAGGVYRRINEFTFKNTYGIDADTYFVHKTPYAANSNPELASFFNTFADAVNNEKSYKYDKYLTRTTSILDDEGNPNFMWGADTGISGYFCGDEVYFSQWGTDTETGIGYTDESHKTGFYEGSDNYDYCATKGKDDYYTGYEYSNYGDWAWNDIVISTNAVYTLNTYAEIGPTFFNLSPDIFQKTSDGHYTVDSELMSTIGTYFDFGFLGVHSSTLESSTLSLDLSLEQGDAGNTIMTVETSFDMMDIHATVTYTFDTASIGTTVLPSWAQNNLPSTADTNA